MDASSSGMALRYFNLAVWNPLKQNALLAELRSAYQNAKPFPHMVFDNVFDPQAISRMVTDFPKPSPEWWNYDNPLERKWAFDNQAVMPDSLRFFIHRLQEKQFTDFLESLTGIEGLITDHRLNGGGLHQITAGGKLDVHADYNYHPVSRLDRRLNVLVYLNPLWQPDWKGDLQLWDKDMTECQVSIQPVSGRMVIFNTTDDSNHGHPDPLECPSGTTRKSVALYYYTNGRPESERTPPHSTIFKKRPGDEADPALDEFRKKRAVKRQPEGPK